MASESYRGATFFKNACNTGPREIIDCIIMHVPLLRRSAVIFCKLALMKRDALPRARAMHRYLTAGMGWFNFQP